jgi:hypothetical protein
VFAAFGQALRRTTAGLEHPDAAETRAALDDARAIDPLLAEAREVLGGPVLAPPSARRQLERYERSLGQVRSTAVDLVRAAELVAEPGDAALERPTEELLAI